MKDSKDCLAIPTPPLDGPSVKLLEDALMHSPTKSIQLEINSSNYQISREGRWFKFSLLTKKRTIKKATLFATITEMYNQSVHGQNWRIAESSSV
ncbi:hypothetical protein P22_1832 [Propionispora sp. 2/2-37]|uniref:hypothetical protein n=1 Tax=Propionispora sp. 2/2-37 TaxID=1677858 RepID=UPI0006C2CCC7|nr:hypothetical protein [Propionispora sp. 2/2-37]CUH95752.1 hypothetical protein P22_1832 [Propionispora sp. 2/2-37]